VAVSVAYIVPTSKFRSAVAKYPLGMSLPEAKALMSKDYNVETSTRLYENGPTPQQMEEDGIYFITVEDENVALTFNYHRRLIEIWKDTWFTRLPIRSLLPGLGLRKPYVSSRRKPKRRQSQVSYTSFQIVAPPIDFIGRSF
jgi:hypothetical protein